LIKRVTCIEHELIILQKNKPTTLTQPQVTKKHLVIGANASTQTEKKITAERMKIEVKQRRYQVFLPKKEDLLSQTVHREKDRRGRYGG